MRCKPYRSDITVDKSHIVEILEAGGTLFQL